MKERVVRFEVRDRQLLEQMAAAPLPLGLQETSNDLQFFRAIYFDTPAGDLEQRSASVCLRISEQDQTVIVDVRDYSAPDSGVVRRHDEAVARGSSPEEIFAQDSGPARLVRALIDPRRLLPAFEMEVTRRSRTAVAGPESVQVSFYYDAVTVRQGELVGELFELEVCMPESAASVLEALVQAAEQQHGIRVTLTETATRARDLFNNLEIRNLEQVVRSAREVAVIAYEHGRIALHPVDGKLHVPVGPGSGQEAARRVIRNYFGRSEGRLRYLGMSRGSVSTPAVEVWLAEEVWRGAGTLTWNRLEDLLGMVGTPALRDARTLTALHAVARSDLASRTAIRSQRGQWPQESDDVESESLFELSVPRSNRDDAVDTKDLPPDLLLNTELSRLSFDERILTIVEDPDTPLLERVRFLSMFWMRLDDFFMTRIADFMDDVAEGKEKLTPDGMTAFEQLEATRLRARQIAGRAYSDLIDQLLPALSKQGIEVLRWADLQENERQHLLNRYGGRVETVITPVIADPTHPFPHTRNLRPAIGALVRLPESKREHFVAIQFPGELPRFLPLPGGHRFVPLEELILAVLPRLYRGVEVVQAHTFRVTRSGNVDFPQEGGTEVITAVEAEIAKRPFGAAVRLEVESTMPAPMRDLILRELQFESPDVPNPLSEADVYPAEWLVDLVALKEIAAVDLPRLKFEPLHQSHPLDQEQSIFTQIQQREHFVHFPHDSFESSVERLIVAAAADPDVIAIKLTLYRTDAQSRIVRALAEARSAGKDAFALVELKASFDERRNIDWARSLESAGVHVVYSPVNFKVHAKTALVLRREGNAIRQYAYIGTGNLNASTARGYTDVGLFTADPALTEEVNSVFNVLTGYSAGAEFKHLLVSPFNMRERFTELIDREIEHARAGRGGHMRIQLNGLADRRMINALYRASKAGVRIELAVREICALRPGLPGVSDHISVVSKLGRFLQHARIFRFNNNGSPEYFIGSADWRPRNLSKRVEVIAPIRSPEHRAVIDRLLDSILHDPADWKLQSDGSYVRGKEVIGAVARQRRKAG
jgi:polyphosphate kinase